MDQPQWCALCRTHPVDPKWRPFCSRRCQVLDQARWADENYRIPGPAAAVPGKDGDDDQDDG